MHKQKFQVRTSINNDVEGGGVAALRASLDADGILASVDTDEFSLSDVVLIAAVDRSGARFQAIKVRFRFTTNSQSLVAHHILY